MLTLAALLEKIVSQDPPVLASSRLPPLKTAVTQYARMFGTTPQQCWPAQYNRPNDERNAFITVHANPTLGSHAVRNLKNNISLLLRLGMQLKLIPSLTNELESWLDIRRLTDATKKGMARHESPVLPAYGLRPLPPHFAQELEAYAEWSTAAFVPDRPASIKKRPLTFELGDQPRLICIAGFLVYHQGLPAETLSLRDLIESSHVEAFITWWIRRRGQVTETIFVYLENLEVLAKYRYQDAAAAAAIRHLKRRLPKFQRVRNKDQQMLPLEKLEAIGRSIHPFNPRRLQELPNVRRLDQPSRWTDTTGRFMAVRAGYSLIIRLLVRHPIRLRNIVEMRLGHNLLQQPDGRWRVRFVGEELKVAHRRGEVNRLTFHWPPDLQAELEEWLAVWRPRLLTKSDPGHVFLSAKGNPCGRSAIRDGIRRTTYRFTGVAVSPHLFRDIWATQYLESGGKVHVAAQRLGNTEEMIHRHYAHLLNADTDREGDAWIAHRLYGDKPGYQA
jgi:hypothetical protein